MSTKKDESVRPAAKAVKKDSDCFIIAPISTPKELVELYGGDANHHDHVLRHLIMPAVEEAGLNAIPPVMEGTDVIHAKIIQNLQDAPYVVCDISTLNPNVMLELGIRTALNKPAILIRDSVTPTEKIPFDIDLINNHKYETGPSWLLVEEITKLANHIEKSIEEKDNALWKYFGLRLTAERVPEQPGTDAKMMNLLLSEFSALRREMSSLIARQSRPEGVKPAPNIYIDPSSLVASSRQDDRNWLPPVQSIKQYLKLVGEKVEKEVTKEITGVAEGMGLKVAACAVKSHNINLYLTADSPATKEHEEKLRSFVKSKGYDLVLFTQSNLS
jgi:hypothetical protein